MSDASAPGKLVIAGEYAVLHGAPAIATAVGVRAHGSVVKCDGSSSFFIDSASGREYEFECSENLGFRWLGSAPRERGAILQAVLETVLAEVPGLSRFPDLKVGLDTDAFYSHVATQSVKLGLGSSAAVLVALVGALMSILEISVDDQSMTRICVMAHQRFQRGRGSGIDVAASVNGGLISVRAPRRGSDLLVDRLSWPAGFYLLPVWSGESASTLKLLSYVDSFHEQNPDAFERQIHALIKHAESVNAAWQEQSAPEILSALDSYSDALRNFDQEAEIGIWTEAHERLRAIAERSGARYKTSGAGGGDFGFAYTDVRAVAYKVMEAYGSAGVKMLELPPRVKGLTIDHLS
jgi:phosphomevalonate kinase